MIELIITTTETIQGYEVSAYVGLVTSRRQNVQLAGKIGDCGFEGEVEKGLDSLKERAEKLGADAIVGLKLSTTERGLYLLGTAVRLSR